MADKKISELTAIVSQSTTDLYESSLNGAGSRKETRAQQNTYWNANIQLPSSAKVTGLDGQIVSIKSLKEGVLHVTPGGSDVGATGSPIQPFGTVTAAYAAGIALGVPFILFCTPGTHTFGDLALVENSMIVGAGSEVTTLSCTGSITCDGARWQVGGGAVSRGGFANFSLALTNHCNLVVSESYQNVWTMTNMIVSSAFSVHFRYQGFNTYGEWSNNQFINDVQNIGSFTKDHNSQYVNYLASTRNPDSSTRIGGLTIDSVGCQYILAFNIKAFDGDVASVNLIAPSTNGSAGVIILDGNTVSLTIPAEIGAPTINSGSPTITYAALAENVTAGFSPTNYTPTTPQVKGHLQGIDDALGSPPVSSRALTGCELSSTANFDATYYNGPNNDGIGATLTATATGSLVFDQGVGLLNDRIILRFQTNGFECGIYKITTEGDTGVHGILTRSVDFNNVTNIVDGCYTHVASGQFNNGKTFGLSAAPAVVGVNDIDFDDVYAGLGITASTGYLRTQWIDFATSATLKGAIYAKFFQTSDTTLKLVSENIAGGGSLVTLTVPVTAGVPAPYIGKIKVTWGNVGGWKIQLNSGDLAYVGSSVTTSGGYISSTDVGDSITLELVAAQTWVASSIVGNLSVN